LCILHDSGKSTQPNCCVPYPAGCIVLDFIAVYRFHDDPYITQERGIWILQICNNKPSDGRSTHDMDPFAIPQIRNTCAQQPNIIVVSIVLWPAAPLYDRAFSPLPPLFINLSDFTLEIPHPQPLVEK
jgi:hypothetical protein